MIVQFNVPCIPIAQPRQRHRVIHSGDRVFATNYTPKTDPVNAFKASVRVAARNAYEGPPLEGPLWVDVIFVMPRPARLIWKKKPMPRLPFDRKPDADNIFKAFSDCLNQLLWCDDSQIVHVTILKVYASGSETAHVEAKVGQYEVSDQDHGHS